MDDLFYVAVVVVFFALMIALVRACDRIVGPDEDELGSVPEVPARAEHDEVLV
jgi:hypothetical protein